MLLRTKCPDWDDDDEHRCSQCIATARDVVVRIKRDAPKRLLDEEMLLSWHRDMFKASVPVDYYAGSFRQDDPARNCLQQDVYVGDFDGSPYQQVLQHMRELVEDLRKNIVRLELNWNKLLPAQRMQLLATIVGSSVGRYIQIHPFLNGNGRTSRLLWSSILYRFGLPRRLSIVKRPGGPYGHAMAAAMQGNFVPVTKIVLAGMSNGSRPQLVKPAQ